MSISELYTRYSLGSLLWQFAAGLGLVVANLLRCKPTVIESECLFRVVGFIRSIFAPAMLIFFLYGFGFAHFSMTRLPSALIFRDLALPRMGGVFFVYVVPAAIANLVLIRGVVALASDIASMRASQEMDVLEVARFHPVHFVFLPRALALMFCAPALLICGVFASFLGAWCACQLTYAPGLIAFWEQFVHSITPWRASLALFKVSLSASIMAFIAGYFAFEAPLERVETVGETTTSAVVTATLAIATVDIVVSLLLDT